MKQLSELSTELLKRYAKKAMDSSYEHEREAERAAEYHNKKSSKRAKGYGKASYKIRNRAK